MTEVWDPFRLQSQKPAQEEESREDAPMDETLETEFYNSVPYSTATRQNITSYDYRPISQREQESYPTLAPPRTYRHPSPMRSSSVPRHVKIALKTLKEDLEKRKSRQVEYGPDQKTEIYIDSLLNESKRAWSHSRAADKTNHSSSLRTTYPLTRNDAKKRKEARFRIKIEKSSVSSVVQNKKRDESNTAVPSDKEAYTPFDQLREMKRKRTHKSQARGKILHKLLTELMDLTAQCSPEPDRLFPMRCYSLDNESDNETTPTDQVMHYCSPSVGPTESYDTLGEAEYEIAADNNNNKTSSRPSEETMGDLLRLKMELYQLQRMSTEHDREPQQRVKKGKKQVRFSAPLVTKVKHRPYTDPEDVEKLFFVADELDEYELDRETTNGDQVECKIVRLDSTPRATHEPRKMTVAIYYVNRPRNLQQPDELMLSPSDLSLLNDKKNHEPAFLAA